MLNDTGFVSLGVYYSLYCTGHWVFAMRYWMIAYRLTSIKYLKFIQWLYYILLILNLACPAFLIVMMIADEDVKIAFWMIIALEVISCFTLFDGCRRIYEFLKNSTENSKS